jgi:hypothetical protein
MGQKIKFYTDEHVAKAVVKGLRERGVDPQHRFADPRSGCVTLSRIVIT